MSGRKIIALICVILAFCSVLGLNARLDYPSVKIALERMGQSANVLVDDFTIIDCFAYIFEDFRMGQTTDIEYIGYVDSSFMGTGYAVDIRKNQGFHISADGVAHEGVGGRIFTFSSERTALRIMNALEPLTWEIEGSSANNFWSNIVNGIVGALNVVVLILGVIFSLLQAIFVFVTDSISTAWSAVSSAMYIFGF